MLRKYDIVDQCKSMQSNATYFYDLLTM